MSKRTIEGAGWSLEKDVDLKQVTIVVNQPIGMKLADAIQLGSDVEDTVVNEIGNELEQMCEEW